MRTYKHPSKEKWPEILRRPVFESAQLEKTVANILKDVKVNGDEAISKYSEQFDKVSLDSFEVTQNEIQEAINMLSSELKNAIQLAKSNIEAFHLKQQQQPEIVETMPGVHCWRKNLPIESVGLYIPGGTAPLFSTVLMLGVPAKIAGCQQIVLCTPPNTNGEVHPAILYTANLVGINRIFKVGGVQAIGGMTYGTDQIPQVYKLFGPGNQYVTCAKQLVNKEGIAIDMPAGPSEVLVCADETAEPAFVAADLLSQAEHGVDSQVVLVTFSEEMVEKIQDKIDSQLEKLPRKEIAKKALENSVAIVVKSRRIALDITNAYAPEHLILAVDEAELFGEKVVNSGSVFLGNYSPESVGDYASGTNHTLPTNGFARAYSGVSLDSFVKKITFQRLSPEGIQNLGKAVELLAEAEGLHAHKEAVSIRLAKLNSQS